MQPQWFRATSMEESARVVMEQEVLSAVLSQVDRSKIADQEIEGASRCCDRTCRVDAMHESSCQAGQIQVVIIEMIFVEVCMQKGKGRK
jgi:hypothetical protein